MIDTWTLSHWPREYFFFTTVLRENTHRTFYRLGWKYYVRFWLVRYDLRAQPVNQIVYVIWLGFEIGFIWMYLVETKNVSFQLIWSMSGRYLINSRIANARGDSCVSTHSTTVLNRLFTWLCRLFDGEDTVEELAQTAAEKAQVDIITEHRSDREKASTDDIVVEDLPTKVWMNIIMVRIMNCHGCSSSISSSLNVSWTTPHKSVVLWFR